MALADRFEGYSSIFANDHPIGVDLKAMADTLRKMPEEKFTSIVNASYKEEKKDKDEKDKEAFVMTPPVAPGAGAQLGTRQPVLPVPGGIHSAYPGMKPEKGMITPQLMERIKNEVKLSPEQVKKFEALALGEAAEVEAGAGMKPTVDPWTKQAANHVAQNLLRDVLGMNKTQIEDTHRHQTKVQDPDGDKTPELKHTREQAADTGRALTPEQVPSVKEKLDSHIYPKSKGAIEGVTKKLATSTEETPESTSAEPQDIKKKEKEEKDAAKMTPEDTAKKVKKMEDEKKKEEAKAKSRPEAEAAPAEKEKEKAGAEAEANVLTAEGIEFENVMQDGIDPNSPEIQKLSSLFEMKK